MTVYVAMAMAWPFGGFSRALAQDHDEQVVVVTNIVTTADAHPASPRTVVIKADARGDADDPFASPAGAGAGQRKMLVRTDGFSGEDGKPEATAWLGLSVEESPEALSSQLGLKAGEGLTVTFISPDSPAAKAGFQKNDVLAELDGQMLVDDTQLRKLVQMHAEGDTVKLIFFRAGKKQSVEVKLAKRMADHMFGFGAGSSFGGMPKLEFRMDDLDGKLPGMQDSLARAGLNKAEMQRNLERALQQSSRAIQESIRNVSDLSSLTNLAHELEVLASNSVDMDKDSTVTVRSRRNASRTIVNTDDDGTLIYEAGKKKHLTARDKDGKTIFDGDIDTPEEKAKVPKAVMDRFEDMLERNTFDSSGGSGGSGGSPGTP